MSEQCETSHDCGFDECCVSLRNSHVKICKKRPQLGNHCRPNLMPGSRRGCPCTMGLTCALVSFDSFGRYNIYRCVLVPEEDIEMEARQQ
ncbi:hypothetical protein QZH41_017101 [Actinostola sp. cb2023]|nr:hypothetical protein QZH41_017101 [Actinostola sp. cb2023]